MSGGELRDVSFGLVVCVGFRWIHLKGILRLVEIFMENRCVNLI